MNKSLKKLLVLFVSGFIVVNFGCTFEEVNANDNNLDKTNGAQAAAIQSIAEVSVRILHNLIYSTWQDMYDDGFPVWRSNEQNQDRSQVVFRYSASGPDTVFSRGLLPRNNIQSIWNFSWNLNRYVHGFYQLNRNPFVSTTRPVVDENNEITHSWQPSESDRRDVEYLYEIYAPGGIDINESLGSNSPYPFQREITFPGGIRPEFIRSVQQINFNRNTGAIEIARIFVNPNFIPIPNIPNLSVPEGVNVVQWEPNNNDNTFLYTEDTALDPMKRPGSLEPFLLKKDENKSIADGDYYLKKNKDSSKEVARLVEPDSGSQVKMMTKDRLGIWNFSYNDDKKAYKIKNDRNKNLLFTWNSNADPTEAIIRGYTEISDINQYWNINSSDDNTYYNLINSISKRAVLDISKENPNDLIVNAGPLNTKGWQLESVQKQPLKDGKYIIQPFKNKNLSLKDKFYKPNDFPILDDNYELYTQRWNFVYNKDKNAYRISGAARDSYFLSWDYGNEVLACTNKENDDQYWQLTKIASGNYIITNYKYNNITLTSRGRMAHIGTDIYTEDKNQQWAIKPFISQTIEDGEYLITPKKSLDQAVTLLNRTIGLGDNDLDHTVKWRFTYDKNRLAYRVVNSKESNISLAWDSHHSDNLIPATGDFDDQYWRLTPTEDGYFYLKNYRDPSKAMQLPSNSDNHQLKVGNLDESDKQKWYLHKTDQAVVADGMYNIAPLVDYKQVMDDSISGEQAIIQPNIGKAEQFWYLQYDKEKKAYTIRGDYSRELGLSFVGKNKAISIDHIDSFNKENELRAYWIIQYDATNGGYILRSAFDPSYVTNFTQKTPVEDALKTTLISGSKDQSWYLQPASSKQTLVDGTYTINSHLGTRKSIFYNSETNSAVNETYSGKTASLWTITYDKEKRAYLIHTDQKDNLGFFYTEGDENLCILNLDTVAPKDEMKKYWHIEYYEGQDEYVIKNAFDSTKVLDLKGSSTENGTPILVYNQTLSDNQFWNFKKIDQKSLSNGTYTISTKLNDKKVIDTELIEDNNIFINDYKVGTPEQMWILNYSNQYKAYTIFNKEVSSWDTTAGVTYKEPWKPVTLNNTHNLPQNERRRQYWTIEYSDQHKGYIIRSLFDPNYVLDMSAGGVTNNTPIIAWKPQLSRNQLWSFHPTEISGQMKPSPPKNLAHTYSTHNGSVAKLKTEMKNQIKK